VLIKFWPDFVNTALAQRARPNRSGPGKRGLSWKGMPVFSNAMVRANANIMGRHQMWQFTLEKMTLLAVAKPPICHDRHFHKWLHALEQCRRISRHLPYAPTGTTPGGRRFSARSDGISLIGPA
jgi:hypothetical protein